MSENILKKRRCMLLFCGVAGALLLAGCRDEEPPVGKLMQKSVEAGRTGRWQEAEEAALAVLKQQPGNSDALLLRALAAEKQNQMSVALDSAKQAAELDPENFAAQYSYGRMLAKHPDSAKLAMQPLERARKLRSKDRNTLILLGQCGSRINANETINYYLALPRAVQQQPEILTSMAIYYLNRRDRDPGNLGRALNSLGMAYKVAPDSPGVVLNLAMFLDHYVHNRAKAAGFYKRYLRLTEHNPELNPTRAQVQSRLRELR